MKEWTVMVYMAGNNNLSEDMVTTLQSLKVVGDKNDCKINILARFNSSYPPVPTGYYEFSARNADKTLFECKLKDEQVYEQSHGSISDFVSWAKKNYAAKQYILILSGHGDGFQGKTLLYDNVPFGSNTPGKLREELEKCTRSLGEQFAVLGFDSCAMNMLELCYEFKDSAKYLISSQGLVPMSGYSYERPLEWLLENNNTALDVEIACKFATEFAKTNYNYSLGGRSVEISVCKLDETVRLKHATDSLARDFLSILKTEEYSEDTTEFVQDQFRTLILAAHWKAQTYFYEQNVDLADFCNLLRRSCDQLRKNITEISGEFSKNTKRMALLESLDRVITKCEVVESACAELVVKNSFVGPEYQFSRGVSVFFPWSYLALSVCQNQYEQLLTNKLEGHWFDFILAFTYDTMRRPQHSEDVRLDYDVQNARPSTNGFHLPGSFFSTTSNQSTASHGHRTGGSFRTMSSYRTGGSFKSGTLKSGTLKQINLSTWQGYFAKFKNYWIDWNVKKF